MELTHDEAVRRLWQHRLLWFVLAVATSLMLVVFTAKATVCFIVGHSASPRPIIRIANALENLSSLPVSSTLWLFAPDVDLERVESFLVSPYVGVMLVIFVVCVMERQVVRRLGTAVASIHIAPSRATGASNRVGSVYAGGSVHITQTIHEKKGEQPLWRVVMTGAASTVVGALIASLRAWLEG